MEVNKLVHKSFLFCMFLICALTVVFLVHSKVQASLSATVIDSSSTTSAQVAPISSAANSIPVTNEKESTIKTTQNTVDVIPEVEIKSTENTINKSAAPTTAAATAEARMKAGVKTNDSINDVETMKKLILLDDNSNNEAQINPQLVEENTNNASDVNPEKEEIKSEEITKSPVLTGQVFTQPTIILASELEKEKNPKLSGDLNENLSIGNVELIRKYDGQKSLLFKGKAEPNSSFNIFVFSKDPVVMTIMSDENGNWSYELTKDLADGQHETYVAVTEKSGRIVSKAAPFAFVKTAEAATSIPVSELDDYKSPMQRSTANYVLIAITIMSVCLAVALALIGILNHKHKTDEAII